MRYWSSGAPASKFSQWVRAVRASPTPSWAAASRFRAGSLSGRSRNARSARPTAVGLAERALRLLPDNAPARNLLAAAQLGVGDARTALTHCENLLAGAPDDQYLIALQTTAWRLLGDARYE